MKLWLDLVARKRTLGESWDTTLGHFEIQEIDFILLVDGFLSWIVAILKSLAGVTVKSDYEGRFTPKYPKQ